MKESLKQRREFVIWLMLFWSVIIGGIVLMVVL
jgi:hypothetical protein